MAVTKHFDILKDGVEIWNEWRERERHVRPDLSGLDISGVRLKRANLRAADLRWSDLHRADLNEANLSGADLHTADLHEANLKEANLDRANLSNAKLHSTEFYRASLIEANLDRAYLIKANLRRAKLRMANLRRSNLYRADLSKADLSGAFLYRADLSRTEFSDANLSDAKLREAKLFFTNLSRAELKGADLTAIGINFAILGDVDLSGVKGLETIFHNCPSVIGIDTLNNSKGQIPEAFLRGCGLKDWEIEQAKLCQPELTPNQINDIVYKIYDLRAEGLMNFYSCFISYCHTNKSFSHRLHDQLQDCGIRCWLDEHQLLPGDDMHDMIDRGIRLWDKVLLCCSEDSLSSWWVDKELDRAIQKEERLWKERGCKVLSLIPLDLDGYLFKGWEGGKKAMITSRLAADFKGWESDNDKFEKGFAQVVKALRADEGAREKPPVSKL